MAGLTQVNGKQNGFSVDVLICVKAWSAEMRLSKRVLAECCAETSERTAITSPGCARPGRVLLALAIGSLMLAGAFALWLVVGRLPGLAGLFNSAQFFKRCLVVHVDLSLVVWFYAFSAALFTLLPGTKMSNRLALGGGLIAAAGAGAMVLGIFMPNSEPVLSNYVPVLNHPIFLGGLIALFAGLLFCFLNDRLLIPSSHSKVIPPAAAIGLKTAAIIYGVAMIVFISSWISTPDHLEAKLYYELLFWGGGHVLQTANAATMLAVWIILLSSLAKKPVVSPKSAGWLFGLLLIPQLASPLLTMEGTTSSLYRVGFTRLMQFGIFPVTLVMLVICLRNIRGASISRKDFRFMGFVASVGLTLAGFALGACIRSSTTLIPAHYHASIGAVTASLMAVAYVVLPGLGYSLREQWRRWLPVQLMLFGGGQLLFALGFGWAGAHGLGRKAYGAEQHVKSLQEVIGLSVMGLGGLIAIAGGLLFLFFMASSRRNVHRELNPVMPQPKVKLSTL